MTIKRLDLQDSIGGMVMSEFEKQEVSISCPNCKRDFDARVYDLAHRHEAKCPRCGTLFKFSSSGVSTLQSKIRDIDRAFDALAKARGAFDDALENAFESAQVILKKR